MIICLKPPDKPFGLPGGFFVAKLQDNWEEMMEFR